MRHSNQECCNMPLSDGWGAELPEFGSSLVERAETCARRKSGECCVLSHTNKLKDRNFHSSDSIAKLSSSGSSSINHSIACVKRNNFRSARRRRFSHHNLMNGSGCWCPPHHRLKPTTTKQTTTTSTTNGCRQHLWASFSS